MSEWTEEGRERMAGEASAEHAGAERVVPAAPVVRADAPVAGAPGVDAVRSATRRRIDCTDVEGVPRWVGASGR